MKRHCIFAAVMVLIALMLCACSRTPPHDTAPAPEQPAEKTVLPGTPLPAPSTPAVVRLSMATGGTSGTYYPYGWALAMAVEESTGYIKTIIHATGASVENLQQIAGGMADLAIVQNDVLAYAYNGTHIWAGTPVKNVTTLMSLYPEYCQLIVATDSGIKSVADLRGRNISAGDIGSGVEANAIQILEAHGLTLADTQNHSLGFSASSEAMQNRTIDAFFATSGVPNSAVMQLSTVRDILIIGIEDNIIDALIEKYPFYTKVEITENTYNFLSAPINTVAVQATLVTDSALDEQVVYDIVKSIIEDKSSIRVAHAKGAFIDAKYAVQGVSVDFHPGARRYFEEIGVL